MGLKLASPFHRDHPKEWKNKKNERTKRMKEKLPGESIMIVYVYSDCISCAHLCVRLWRLTEALGFQFAPCWIGVQENDVERGKFGKRPRGGYKAPLVRSITPRHPAKSIVNTKYPLWPWLSSSTQLYILDGLTQTKTASSLWSSIYGVVVNISADGTTPLNEIILS
jgi:hypothetical protein